MGCPCQGAQPNCPNDHSSEPPGPRQLAAERLMLARAVKTLGNAVDADPGWILTGSERAALDLAHRIVEKEGA